MSNWFKQLVSGNDRVGTKENADKVNNISDEEMTKLYKIAVVSLINKTQKPIRVSGWDFRPDEYIFKRGVFSAEPKYGATSQTFLCTDIKNLLNSEIGHSTVIDLNGESKNLHRIDIPRDIALLILHDSNIRYPLKLQILMSEYYSYIEEVERNSRDRYESRNVSSSKLLSKTIFTETPKFLEMVLVELSMEKK